MVLPNLYVIGKTYLWAKEKLAGILLVAVLLILVFYVHSEYLNYVEFKSKNEGSYIGTSFIIKNTLIVSNIARLLSTSTE